MQFNPINMPRQENSILAKDYGALARVGQHQGDSYIGRGAKQRPICRPKNFPELIGAIDQGTSSTRFLVFENQTGHLIASSQMEIKRITPKEGWVEIDPASIMSSVHATIANVYDQLVAKYDLQSNCDEQTSISNLLSCIGICNQRESTIVWDSKTGEPLYNVIVWMDNRTKYIVDAMIDAIPGRDFNRFKDETGLPMSTYFSAFKLKWLMDNVDEVKQALKEDRLLFGTVDSWILWNLTGEHLTDVTNASRTFLMDIDTLQWDKSLCKHFKVPMNILPEIRASADKYGLVQCGPFIGTPITGVIGDQSAALFGHNCLQMGQTKATFGTGCFIMQNIGPGPISGALSGVHRDAKRGLVTTVGYKLGDRPACYALEGCVKIAGAALTWLRDNIQLIENYEECDILVNKTTHSAGVFFVPALGGLYSPYWDPNAAGMFIGLSQFTRREHMIRATYDSIAFQTDDILSLMRGVKNGLMIDGGLCKSDNLCQILADITGYDIIRPSMCETSALGAAMVAGYGAELWSYESMLAHSNEPLDVSRGHLNQTHHYPHASLNYRDKYSVPAKQFNQSQVPEERIRVRTKSMTSNEAAANHRHNSFKQSRSALAALNQQHHRQHLKSANGVNDDAGGGKEGDRGGGGPGYEDFEDAGSAASSQLVASMATTNATEFTASAIITPQLSPLESSLELSGRDDQTKLIGPPEVNSSSVPPSSAYSSGDNSDQTASLSGVSVRGRIDSPLSQATEGFASLSMTSNVNLSGQNVSDPSNSARHQNLLNDHAERTPINCDDAIEITGGDLNVTNQGQEKLSKIRDFSYNLKNFFAQQSNALNKTRVGELDGILRLNIDNDSEDQDDGDLVHEFGGRDSYGEDGYTSSNASFASYVTDDDEEDADYNNQRPLTMLSIRNYESSDRHVNGGHSDSSVDQQQGPVVTKANRQRSSRRQRKSSSILTKQTDVFQPYISIEHRTDLVGTWRLAVERSMQWTKVHHEEVKRIDYQRLSSLPISMYLFFSIGIVALSGIIRTISFSGFPPSG